ncbi:MAG: hypothetical protein V1668_00995 [Patescibacteria group bacterium]
MSPQTRRNLLIGAAILIVLVIAGVAWWLLSNKDTPTTNSANTNTALLNTDVVIINASTNKPAATNTATTDEVALVRLANLFTERYGSYSSEAGFQNITDLKPYMTKKMQVISDSFVTSQKAQSSSSSFFSTTTNALSTSIASIAKLKATINVSAQRRETGVTIDGTSTYYQVLVLDFAKEGETWLVDNAAWQAKGSL